jgi:hypothetical protein
MKITPTNVKKNMVTFGHRMEKILPIVAVMASVASNVLAQSSPLGGTVVDCRLSYKSSVPTINEDSIYVHELTMNEYFAGQVLPHQKYLLLNGTGDIILAKNYTQLLDCFYVKPDYYPTGGGSYDYEGCGVSAGRDFLVWYNHELEDMDHAHQIISSVPTPGYPHVNDDGKIEWKEAWFTKPSILKRDLGLALATYYANSPDGWYNVTSEERAHVDDIYKVLATGHPVIAYVRVREEKPLTAHYIVIYGAVYDGDIGEVRFLTLDPYYDFNTYTASELESKMWASPLYPGHLIFTNTQLLQHLAYDDYDYHDIFADSDYKRSALAATERYALSQNNKLDYITAVRDEEEDAVLFLGAYNWHNMPIDPDYDAKTPYPIIGFDNIIEEDNMLCGDNFKLDFVRGGSYSVDYMCDWYHVEDIDWHIENRSRIGLDKANWIDRTKCVNGMSQIVKNYQRSWIRDGDGLVIGVHPTKNLTFARLREVVSGQWKEPEETYKYIQVIKKNKDAYTDKDQDGIMDYHDNCPCVANKSQTDCDKDGIGDECDNDLCMEILGVKDWTPEKTIIVNNTNLRTVVQYGSTPDKINISYRGAPNSSYKQSRAETRFCSCEGFAQDANGREDCQKWECDMYFPSVARKQVQKHTAWHHISYDSKHKLIGSVNRTCPSGTYRHTPTTSCTLDSTYSNWEKDVETNWCTFHCAPEYVDLRKGQENKYNYTWLWRKELWWKETKKNWQYMPSGPNKKKSDWGFLWLRPDELDRAPEENNNYHEFKLDNGSWRGSGTAGGIQPAVSIDCSVVPCVTINKWEELIRWPDLIHYLKLSGYEPALKKMLQVYQLEHPTTATTNPASITEILESTMHGAGTVIH